MSTDDIIIVLKSIASQTAGLARVLEAEQHIETPEEKKLRLLQRRDEINNILNNLASQMLARPNPDLFRALKQEQDSIVAEINTLG
jgi:hypothetical protein